jgi:hypothetical protein
MMTHDTLMMLVMFWLAVFPLLGCVLMINAAIGHHRYMEWTEHLVLWTMIAMTFMLFLACVGIGIDIGYPGTILTSWHWDPSSDTFFG